MTGIIFPTDDTQSVSSMLEAETRYLPLHSEFSVSPLKPFSIATNNNSPVSGPQDSRQQTTLAEVFASKQDEKRSNVTDRSCSANNNNRSDPSESANSRLYQNQQNALNSHQQYQYQGGYHSVDPQQQNNSSRYNTNQGQNKRMAANFLPSKSESQPQEHTKKRSVSPVTKAQEFFTESDIDSAVEDTQSSLELKLLKALLANRQSKRSARKSVQDGATNYAQDISSSPYRLLSEILQINKLICRINWVKGNSRHSRLTVLTQNFFLANHPTLQRNIPHQPESLCQTVTGPALRTMMSATYATRI